MENIIIAIIIILVVFVIAREILCWYWKINKVVENQEKLLEIMEDILFEMQKSNIKNNKDFCINLNDKSTP